MGKRRVYSLGLLTLLMLPLGWIILRFLGHDQPTFQSYFRWKEFFSLWTPAGIAFGSICGAIMLYFTRTDHAREHFSSQIELVKSLNLSVVDAVFLSLCAGLGEEFLFRITLQEWVHPLIAAVIFVAIHGYIRPTDWNVTRYGLGVLVFIIALSYAVKVQGIWFCIAAHAAYDFVLFHYWSGKKQNENEIRSKSSSPIATDENDTNYLSNNFVFRDEAAKQATDQWTESDHDSETTAPLSE